MDDTEPIPAMNDDVRAKAHHVLTINHVERALDWVKLGLIFVLIGINVFMWFALERAETSDQRSQQIIRRTEHGQRSEECDRRRVGEYLASFSDYLNVPPGDPFRRELDRHLKKVADQMRRLDDPCDAPIPEAPTPTTTTTTTLPEPPPAAPTVASRAAPAPVAASEPSPASSAPSSETRGMEATIEAGTRVIITDAEGAEYEVDALSGVEQKGHAFPLVWVNRPLNSGDFEPTPWPADAVRVVVAK